MNLAEFRKQYPQYDQVSDLALTDRLYEKHYSGRVPKDEFKKRFMGDQYEHEFDAGTMVGNAPQSAMDLFNDFYTALTNPIDTAEGLGKVIGGAIQKYHPDAATQDLVPYADAAGQYYADRYGSWENTQYALENDPVGVLSDVAAIASIPAALPRTAGKVGKAVAKATDPMSLVIDAPLSILKQVTDPTRLYNKSAKFPPSMDRALRHRVTDTAVKNRIVPNEKGWNKLQTKIAGLGNQLNTLLDEGPDVPIKSGKVLRYVDELKKSYGGFNVDADKSLKAIDKVVSDFETMVKKNKFEYVSPNDLQQFKLALDRTINYKKRTNRGNQAKTDTRKALRRGAKDTLNETIPGIGRVNEQLAPLMELRENLGPIVGKTENRSILGMPEFMGGTAGGVMSGDPTGIMGGVAVAEAATNPNVLARLAIGSDLVRNNPVSNLISDMGPSMSILRRVLMEAEQMTPDELTNNPTNNAYGFGYPQVIK